MRAKRPKELYRLRSRLTVKTYIQKINLPKTCFEKQCNNYGQKRLHTLESECLENKL